MAKFGFKFESLIDGKCDVEAQWACLWLRALKRASEKY